MQYELQARTEPGRLLVAVAETLAAECAISAAQHDRDAAVPLGNIAALKRCGYFGAAIPRPCGGLGVESVRDILIASSRLARGDAAITLGVNMHLAATIALARQHRIALAAGDEARAT